jgi:hypothetical protein
MSDIGLDIVSLAADRIQAMRPLRRALLAREALVLAAGKTAAVGPREARLRKLLEWTGRCGMIAVSMALLVDRYFAGRKAGADRRLPEAIFLGIGAMREQSLRTNVEAELGLIPHFVDQRTPSGFAGLPAPSFARVIVHWIHVTREALATLSNPDPHFPQMDLLSTLTMRAHELAYLLAWFENLHNWRPDMPIFCSTADLSAHAACLSGFSVEYRQHGFLARALVFPSFRRMVALTEYEGRYVASRVPALALKVHLQRATSVFTSGTLAITGDYQAQDPALITSLVELAHANGFRVVVRPHPRGCDELWSWIRGRENVIFDTEGGFEDFLEKWRPTFLASWFSTTLLDGLLAGALPITLSRDNGILLLPVGTIALSWPEQGLRIKNCMSDPEERQRTHERLMDAVQP